MPLFFSLGMRSALVAVKAKLKEGERLFAFLDDVYVICTSSRVLQVFQLLEAELYSKAHISVHQGKTQIWNRGGQEPSGAAELTAAARMEKPEAVVWRGDPMLSLADQGLIVLGAPVGQPEFVQARLVEKSGQHQKLLQMIPHLQDVQAAWLLILYCAAPRANFLLRTVLPELTSEFARNHDEQLVQCLSRVLQAESFPTEVKIGKSMPLTLGGLGIGGAVGTPHLEGERTLGVVPKMVQLVGVFGCQSGGGVSSGEAGGPRSRRAFAFGARGARGCAV